MLRRLVLEWSLREISKKLKNPENHTGLNDSQAKNQSFNALGLQTLEMLKHLKSIEVLQLLRFDSEEFAAIIKVETKASTANPEQLLDGMFEAVKGKVHFLERDKKGAYTYLVTGKMPPQSPEMDSKKIMYPFLPFSFRDGKFRITLVGDSGQVKQLLDAFDSLGLKYRIVSLTDAKFSPTSPVSRLTVKQQDAIVLAFRLGYFDTPRKVSVDVLAGKLGLASSTLAVHLRRAERRLLAEVLKESTIS
jgi:predicted DNA binding protein